jgi:cytochrome P450
MSDNRVDPSIVTPVGTPGFFATLLSPITRALAGPGVQGFGARLAARYLRKPFRLGDRVFAVTHADVRSVLERDLDFGIAAVNAKKIEEVNGGPFILGMDRSAALERERRALYTALAAVDMDRLKAGVEAEVESRLAPVEPGGALDVVGGYARPTAAHTAQRLFGISGPDDSTFMEATRSIFGHTFLNLSDDPAIRDRGIAAGRLMQGWLAEEIARRRGAAETGDDLMGALMQQGELDDAGIRRTLGGMLVGSVDTTATCVAKIVAVLRREPDLQHRMRRDRDDLGGLYNWCLEALRVWSHNPLVLRQATADTALGDLAIKAGERVFALTLPAMYDPEVFDEPRRLRGDRDRSAYLHFGGGLHPCSGGAVNRFQIPLLVRGLVDRGISGIGRVEWAGGFPHRLVVTLGRGAA